MHRSVTKLACLCLLLASLGFASGQRAALVILTEGKNVVRFEGEEASLRTLQVLPQGARISLGEGARLRLSYLSSGVQETITGPCEVEIQQETSRKVSGAGKLQSRSTPDSSTGLPSTENLRRTGGALHASITESPGEMLARLEFEDIYPQPSSHSNTRNSRILFLDRQKAYLDPNAARRVTWSQAPDSLTLCLLNNGKPTSTMSIKGQTAELPPDLKPGRYTVQLLNGDRLLASDEFTILNAKERQAIEAAEKQIRNEEPAGSRPLYSRLLRLQTETGLYKEAEKTAAEAVQAFPDDSGFLFMAALIKEELGKREEAKALLRQADNLES